MLVIWEIIVHVLFLFLGTKPIAVGLTVFLISKTFGWTDCISKMNQKNHCACTISDFRFLGMKIEQIQATR